MNSKQVKSVYLLLAVALLVFLPYNANAYIDPNTGGFFFSSVLPFVYGLLAALVVFWKRIVHFIKNLFTGDKHKSDS